LQGCHPTRSARAKLPAAVLSCGTSIGIQLSLRLIQLSMKRALVIFSRSSDPGPKKDACLSSPAHDSPA